jgi:peptide/nickel transport system substrate-binding protein
MVRREMETSRGSRRATRRSVLRAGGLGVVAGSAAWMLACGGRTSDSGSAGSSSGAAPGVAPTQQAALRDDGTPKPGGTVTWRDIGAPPPLDPTNNPTYRAQQLAGFTYSRLLKFKTGPEPTVVQNYEVLPDLAASYEILDGGLQYTFKLQPNAKFHNKPPVSGRAVVAEDVRASLERFRTAPKNTNRAAFGSDTRPIVTSLETPDQRTVVVKLAQPYAPILNLFANPQYLWIMPRETDGTFDPTKDQIGSGPYILDRIEPDVSVSLRRNPEYFVQGRPHLEGIRLVAIPEEAQNVAQFQAGKLDWTPIPAASKAEVERTNPRSQVITYIPTTYTFLSPQLRGNSPLKDVRVRRALSMSIDRKAWLDVIYNGQGSAYLNAVPASMGKWWLNPQGADAGPGGQWFKHDPRAARELLRTAGQDNMALRFIFTNNAYGDVFNQGAEATAGMLKEGGFNTQVLTQDYLREYIDARGTFFGTYEGLFYGLQTPFTDPHDYLFNMNHPGSARNHAGVDDPRLTAMIDDEQGTIDEAARVKKVQDIQRYMMEQLYYVPIAVGYAYQFQQPWMRRRYYSSTYGFGTESDLDCWIDRG